MTATNPFGAMRARSPATARPAGLRDARVLVVDDDASLRAALKRLLRAEGYDVETFASAAALLAADLGDRPTCVVLDVCMPEIDGLSLQQRLHAGGRAPAIVFLSAHGDVPTTVQAMKAGAVDFLEKPVDADALLAAIERGLARAAADIADRRERDRVSQRYAMLTSREREVLALVVTGLPNKHVGARLGASEKTIKVHRGRVMTKMQAGSLAELVRMAEKLAVPPRHDGTVRPRSNLLRADVLIEPTHDRSGHRAEAGATDPVGRSEHR